MKRDPLSDIALIVTALKQREIHVTGPTIENGDPTYRVNGHLQSIAELRSLASENRLTSWEIFSYVKKRDQHRHSKLQTTQVMNGEMIGKRVPGSAG